MPDEEHATETTDASAEPAGEPTASTGEPPPEVVVDESLISFDQYILINPTFRLMTVSMQAAAKAMFKRWIDQQPGARRRHYRLTEWQAKCTEMLTADAG
jgi:hypothetical protein